MDNKNGSSNDHPAYGSAAHMRMVVGRFLDVIDEERLCPPLAIFALAWLQSQYFADMNGMARSQQQPIVPEDTTVN